MEVHTWLLLFCFLFHKSSTREIEGDLRNYQVVELGNIQPFKSEEQLITALNLPLGEDIEVLSGSFIDGTAQVLVNPNLREGFKTAAETLSLSQKVIIEDVGQLIENEKRIRADMAELKGNATFDRYMTYDEIENYLKTIGNDFPEKVKVETIGQSYEGENISMITISDFSRRAKGKTRPVIFVEAGIHAREWISVASAVYLIETLVKANSSLTETVEWKIIPVLNPDGYKYSWSKHRFWRKNRRPHYYAHCFGVDLNRNFDSFWNTLGVSTLPCSNIYAGSQPFSEPETKAIENVFRDPEFRRRVEVYVSIHSYGQYIFFPPGYNKIHLSPECSNILKEVAKIMSSAIQSSAGPEYLSGTPAQHLYPASGGSMDWAMLSQNIPLAFTFEMRDKGKYGFLLPASHIEETVNDIWVAVNELFKIITHKDSSNLQRVSKYRACKHQLISIRSNFNNDYEGAEATEQPIEVNITKNMNDNLNSLNPLNKTMQGYTEIPNNVFMEEEIEGSSLPSSTTYEDFSLPDYSVSDTPDTTEHSIEFDNFLFDTTESADMAETKSSNSISCSNSRCTQTTLQIDENSWISEPLVSTERTDSMQFDYESNSE